VRASSWRTSRRRITAVALAVGSLTAFAIAPSAAATAARPTTASVISTAKNAKLGKLLVSGTTVYALKPSTTACTAKCLKVWPPVVLPQGVMTATAGPGVDGSKLGTTATADGARQITYAGKRLYWFVKDKAPGQVKGNVTDKWGKWYTIETTKSTSRSTSTTSAGNGGTGF
jgi:predicted lipoprotein with Yx(FWY)xxD motif